jgi:hypothetical protein
VYTSYNQSGWVVILTAYDTQDNYWKSVWRYLGPDPANTVPMWRDVSIADIQVSVPPYDWWTDSGIDWNSYYEWAWRFDTVDFNIPATNSFYYDYALPDSFCVQYGVPPGTTVRDCYSLIAGTYPNHDKYGNESVANGYQYAGPGVNVIVGANNYGSVAEKCIINLYAVGFALKSTGTYPDYPAIQLATFEKIGTWTLVMGVGGGSGYAARCAWMPPINGTYVLFATIDTADGATMEDQYRADNAFAMSKPLSNLNVVDTGLQGAYVFLQDTLVPPGWLNNMYLCDFDNDGLGAFSPDLTFLLSNFGTNAAGYYDSDGNQVFVPTSTP